MREYLRLRLRSMLLKLLAEPSVQPTQEAPVEQVKPAKRPGQETNTGKVKIHLSGRLGLSLVGSIKEGYIKFDETQLSAVLYEQMANHGFWYNSENGSSLFKVHILESGPRQGNFFLLVDDADKPKQVLMQKVGWDSSAQTVPENFVYVTAAEVCYSWLLHEWDDYSKSEDFAEHDLETRLDYQVGMMESPTSHRCFVSWLCHGAGDNKDKLSLDASPRQRCDVVTFLDDSKLWITSQGPTLEDPFAEDSTVSGYLAGHGKALEQFKQWEPKGSMH